MAGLSEYEISDSVRCACTFTIGTTPTDPTTITLTVVTPAGNTFTYTYGAAELTKSSTGVYYRDIVVDTTGEWAYRFVGTGTVDAASQHRFVVRRNIA